MYPFTCARAVVATPAATLAGVEEAEIQDYQSSAETRGANSEGARWVSPGKSLAGDDLRCPGKSLAEATYPTPATPPPLSLRFPTPSTTLEPRLGRCLHGGMQIFVKTKNIQD